MHDTTWLWALLGMVLSGAGCTNARRTEGEVSAKPPASQAPSAGRQADKPAAVGGMPSAGSPVQAQDAGPACSTSGSLEEYCERYICPRQFSVAEMSLCGTSDGQKATNSCSGMSVIHYGIEDPARYDYSEAGDLVGVTLLGGERTCGLSEVTYGQACSVTGMRESLCAGQCGFIACGAGLTIWDDLAAPKDFQSAAVKYCRNDACSSGMFNEKIEAASDNKEIVFYDRLSDSSTFMFMFDTTQQQSSLFIMFDAADQDLQHGDHYLIEVTHPDGHGLYKLDRVIERYDVAHGTPPCVLYCKAIALDFRKPQPDSSDLDAG